MIIGLGHRARSGKDTFADYLVAKHGFTKLSFATPLKEAARDIFLLTDEQMYGSLKEVVDPRWGRTPRDILQKLGTESVRDVFGQETWVQRCKFGMEPGKRYVIADVRFPNEADAIKAWGGYVLKIDRPSLPPIKRAKLPWWKWIWNTNAQGPYIGHPSETALLDYEGWDDVLVNDGTLETLYRRGEGLLLKCVSREMMKSLEHELFSGPTTVSVELRGLRKQLYEKLAPKYAPST
jgi:hypothetical protein